MVQLQKVSQLVICALLVYAVPMDALVANAKANARTMAKQKQEADAKKAAVAQTAAPLPPTTSTPIDEKQALLERQEDLKQRLETAKKSGDIQNAARIQIELMSIHKRLGALEKKQEAAAGK